MWRPDRPGSARHFGRFRLLQALDLSGACAQKIGLAGEVVAASISCCVNSRISCFRAFDQYKGLALNR
jgi:hypothetical protein